MYIGICMKFLKPESHDPYLNLAIEEYLFENSNDDIFMLWQNEPSVIIGKNQNAFAEINLDRLMESNIKIARRITGGGAVYHDLGNINYTYISSQNDGVLDFKKYSEPIIEALASLGIEAILSGRNDIMVGEKKVSGNVQHSKKGRVLHHGTLLFDADLETISDILNPDPEKIKSKAIRSVRSRVANIKPLLSDDLSVSEFIDSIEKFVISKLGAEIVEIPSGSQIELLRERNASSDWIYPKSKLLSDYSLIRKARYHFGTVEVRLNMQNHIISEVKIVGDFFGNRDVSDVEKLLVGKDITSCFELNINISDYIYGMSNQEFVDLIIKSA